MHVGVIILDKIFQPRICHGDHEPSEHSVNIGLYECRSEMNDFRGPVTSQ